MMLAVPSGTRFGPDFLRWGGVCGFLAVEARRGMNSEGARKYEVE